MQNASVMLAICAAMLPFSYAQLLGGVGGYLGTPEGAPRLLGSTMVSLKSEPSL